MLHIYERHRESSMSKWKSGMLGIGFLFRICQAKHSEYVKWLIWIRFTITKLDILTGISNSFTQ